MDLDILKKQYAALTKKYDLPEFKALNDHFEIEKIDKDTDTLLKFIRKIMMEKIVNSLTFLELLMNPVNAPRMYLPYIRSISQEDKTIIDRLYSSLSDLSILSLDLEIDSSEKKEAELIFKIYSLWMSVKPDFRKILHSLKQPLSTPAKKEKSYFG